jgi:hypothetical protein
MFVRPEMEFLVGSFHGLNFFISVLSKLKLTFKNAVRNYVDNSVEFIYM